VVFDKTYSRIDSLSVDSLGKLIGLCYNEKVKDDKTKEESEVTF